MDIAYIPLVATALSILGAAAIYSYQKWIDRKTALIELRRISYRNYLKTFVDMTNTPERIDEITRAHLQSDFELLIVGSDDVIRAVRALDNFYSDTNDDRYNRDVQKTNELVAGVCLAMREDCFEKTNLRKNDITALMPFRKPTK